MESVSKHDDASFNFIFIVLIAVLQIGHNIRRIPVDERFLLILKLCMHKFLII